MEKDWERLRPHIEPSSETIDSQVAEAIPGARIASYSLIEEGHANTNYAVALVDGTRVLLRYHRRDPNGARREAAISEKIAGSVPAPRYLYVSGDGSWSVQEWIEGTSMAHTLDAGLCPDGYSIGTCLAGIGKFTFPRLGFLDEHLEIATPLGSAREVYASHIWHLMGHPRVRERLGLDRACRTKRWMQRDEPLFAEADPTPRLTHSDFKPTNLLIRDRELAGVLDWEFAHAGLSILDVAILMRDPRLSDTSFAPEFEEGFVGAGGFLPPDWMRVANLLDLINLLQFLDEEAAGPNLVTTCLEVVDRYLARHCP